MRPRHESRARRRPEQEVITTVGCGIVTGSGEDLGSGDAGLVVETRRVGDAAVVAVRGELDDLTAPQVRCAVNDSTVDNAALLVIDLTELMFLGYAGLTILLDFRGFAVERGLGFYVVVGNNRRAIRPMEVTGLTVVLPLRGHLDDALREHDAPGEHGRSGVVDWQRDGSPRHGDLIRSRDADTHMRP